KGKSEETGHCLEAFGEYFGVSGFDIVGQELDSGPNHLPNASDFLVVARGERLRAANRIR
ncbi:MAG TPA: hypothetical protein VG649_21595, partial [Candidatus Angelobacter sp.]|nr:hypothetical protein [Candidatus Angelobacter sp.]